MSTEQEKNQLAENSVENSAEKSIEEAIADVNLPEDVREEIKKKAEELKKDKNLRRIFVIIVEGEEGDEKPFYIGYFQRPSMMQFSQYMNFVQKDIVQANKMLASQIFVAGDKEMVDDSDIFLYGTMQQLSRVIDSRNSSLVKK